MERKASIGRLRMDGVKKWSGDGLKGTWTFTAKMDGVRTVIDQYSRTAVSRSNKRLHNFDSVIRNHPDLQGTYEVFYKNWESTQTLVRTINNPKRVVEYSNLYKIGDVDEVDPRLWRATLLDPSRAMILHLLEVELNYYGNEGLVLYNLDSGEMIKVKPKYSVDIRVTGLIEGTGKFKCLLGAFQTKYGKVGTGFSHLDRYNMYSEDLIGSIIEVTYMEKTSGGRLRHPVFQRLRWDKDEENLEEKNVL